MLNLLLPVWIFIAIFLLVSKPIFVQQSNNDAVGKDNYGKNYLKTILKFMTKITWLIDDPVVVTRNKQQTPNLQK